MTALCGGRRADSDNNVTHEENSNFPLNTTTVCLFWVCFVYFIHFKKGDAKEADVAITSNFSHRGFSNQVLLAQCWMLDDGDSSPFLWTTRDSTRAWSFLNCWSEDSTSCSFSSNHWSKHILLVHLQYMLKTTHTVCLQLVLPFRNTMRYLCWTVFISTTHCNAHLSFCILSL